MEDGEIVQPESIGVEQIAAAQHVERRVERGARSSACSCSCADCLQKLCEILLYGVPLLSGTISRICGERKCVDGEHTCRTSVVPSVVFCLVMPFSISLGLAYGDVLSIKAAFVIFWSSAGLACICWPVFASHNYEELQGDYDEGSGLEGCYVHTCAMWCCTLLFVGLSLGIFFGMS